MKNKFHRLRIRQKDPDKAPATANNVEILLDDKPLKGVNCLDLKIEAGDMVRVGISMFVHIDEVDLKVSAEVDEMIAELGSKSHTQPSP